jgi:hypothetical protein
MSPSIIDDIAANAVGVRPIDRQVREGARRYLAHRDRQRAAIDRLVRDRIARESAIERAVREYARDPMTSGPPLTAAELINGVS